MTDTATVPTEPTSKGGMSIFAWLMVIVMVILLLPLLPLYILLKLYALVRNNKDEFGRPKRRQRGATQ